jgi:hypothetical protein
LASRLNLLFQTAPQKLLERTVLFTDELTSPDSAALLHNKQVHYMDIAPLDRRAIVRVLPNVSAYQDLPLLSYYVPPGGFALIPKEDPPCRFVFLPEFVGGRLLVQPDGDDWLRLECEQGLVGEMPAPESQNDSRYVDSFAYWTYTKGHLVGRIRATAVVMKEPSEPWTVYMQQIVGSMGFEVVRQLFSKKLQY